MCYFNSDKKFLGAGSFGYVYKVCDRKNGEILAVKIIDLGMVESSEYKQVG